MLFHSTVVRQEDTGSVSGSIWFDDATVYVPTGLEEKYAEDLSFILYPNPANDRGILSFKLKESSFVKVSIYNLDGKKVEDVCNLNLNPGVQEIHWTPGSSMINGLYLIRTEIRPVNNNPAVILTEQWVLSR